MSKICKKKRVYGNDKKKNYLETLKCPGSLNFTLPISSPIWNEEFELPDGSYSVSDIIIKHETVTDNPSIMIYINKIENRITFKIKKH